MLRAKYSDEFKEQVVREVIEKDRTIASVAASCDLVPQTVGNWVARYKKEHGSQKERQTAAESAAMARLRAQNRELRQENEFLKKRRPGSRRNSSESEVRAHRSRGRKLPDLLNEPFSPGVFVEVADDEGCGGDVGDGVWVEGEVLEGLEVLEHGVCPLGGGAQGGVDVVVGGVVGAGAGAFDGCEHAGAGAGWPLSARVGMPWEAALSGRAARGRARRSGHGSVPARPARPIQAIRCGR